MESKEDEDKRVEIEKALLRFNPRRMDDEYTSKIENFYMTGVDALPGDVFHYKVGNDYRWARFGFNKSNKGFETNGSFFNLKNAGYHSTFSLGSTYSSGL